MGEEMKISKLFSGIFAVLAVVIAVATIAISFVYLNSSPVLLKASEEARMKRRTLNTLNIGVDGDEAEGFEIEE